MDGGGTQPRGVAGPRERPGRVAGPRERPGRVAGPEALACRAAVRASLADLPAGCLVLVACSGGADSLALASALAWTAPRSGVRAGAVVVDHGLQPDSADVAAAAGSACRSLGLDPVEVVPALVATGTAAGGPEAAARTARHAALAATAARLGAAAVLVGHTRDDQAETVLLRLARGSGARSLAGMAPVAGLLRRPFLGLDRETVRASLTGTGLAAWEDPHNADPGFARPRVRHDLLPALEAALGRGAAAALARSADLLRADADALDAWAADALEAVLLVEPYDGGVGRALDVAGLAALPTAVRTRVVRRALLDVGAPAGALTAAHVAAVDRLVTDWHGQGRVDLPGRTAAQRRCGRLLLLGPPPP